MIPALPGVAQEIADVIGVERALYLIGQLPRCIAGVKGHRSARVMLYVPQTLRPNHRLVGILGYADAQRLVDAFGGESLQPPTCAELARRWAHKAIIDLHREGVRPVEIAFLMGRTQRSVAQVLAREQGKTTT